MSRAFQRGLLLVVPIAILLKIAPAMLLPISAAAHETLKLQSNSPAMLFSLAV